MRSRFATRLGLTLTAAYLLAFTGCGDHGADHDHAAHAEKAGEKAGHHHESAHGGVGVELGEHQYFLDVLATPAEGTLDVWIMDAHAENFVRLPWAEMAVELTLPGGASQPLRLLPQASAATGETAGDTSHFRGQAEWLKGQTNFTGTFPRLALNGKSFVNVKFSYPAKP